MLLLLIKATQHGVDGVLGLHEVLQSYVFQGTLHVAAKKVAVCLILSDCWRLCHKGSQELSGGGQALSNSIVICVLAGPLGSASRACGISTSFCASSSSLRCSVGLCNTQHIRASVVVRDERTGMLTRCTRMLQQKNQRSLTMQH